jgi:ribosomal protein S18 acetylase RimI-like enzyme
MVEGMNDREAGVRPATVADVDSIAAVHFESARVFYAPIFPDERGRPSLEDRRAAWSQLLGEDRGWTFVVEHGGEVVGVCHTDAAYDDDLPPGTGEVTTLYMQPDQVGRGLAQLVFRRGVRELIAQDFRRAVLWVLEENPRARRFYEREGWTLDPGVEPRVATPYHDVREVRYRRALAGPDAVQRIVGTG